jgi:hypothetical protein
MGTPGAPVTITAVGPRSAPRATLKERPSSPLHTRPSGTIWLLASDFRAIEEEEEEEEEEDSLDPVGGMSARIHLAEVPSLRLRRPCCLAERSATMSRGRSSAGWRSFGQTVGICS